MIACIHSLKAKAEGDVPHPPRSSLATRTSRSDRGLIISAGVAFLTGCQRRAIWISRRERKKRVFQPRGRRDCFGELVQIDV